VDDPSGLIHFLRGRREEGRLSALYVGEVRPTLLCELHLLSASAAIPLLIRKVMETIWEAMTIGQTRCIGKGGFEAGNGRRSSARCGFFWESALATYSCT